MIRSCPRRPLRSVFLGDLRYCSAYQLGVGQGMALLGAWHRDVSIREAVGEIDRQVREMAPDVIWTHMLLWPPPKAASVAELLELAAGWRHRGARVLVHDGDPRQQTRYPHDVSAAVDLALLNHSRSVSEWCVPALYWPYAAFVQERIGEAVEAFRCNLAFTGLLRDDGLYGPRTVCVRELAERGVLRLFPEKEGANTRMQTADLAASAEAMIGFGRPEVPGWIDTRVFQYPGAGGVLLHDDAGGMLTPNEHFVPVERYDVDSILHGLEVAKVCRSAIRTAAFTHVQANHTYLNRCQQVLDAIYKAAS